MDLSGSVVLITGAGKGAGRHVAELLSGLGARVAVNDISPVNLEPLVALNPQVYAYPEDVAKKVGVQSVVKQVEDDLGAIDILINHASVEPHVPLLDTDEWDWHRVLDVNLTGTFLMIQSVGRGMRERGRGLVFNLISLNEDTKLPSAAYNSSVYGLVALTRAAAFELGPYGICVQALGHSLARFHNAATSEATDLDGTILGMIRSPKNGQFVNLEER